MNKFWYISGNQIFILMKNSISTFEILGDKIDLRNSNCLKGKIAVKGGDGSKPPGTASGGPTLPPPTT